MTAVPAGGGRTIEIRPVRPSDDVALTELYDTLGPDDRHRRFFSVYHPDPSFFTAMATEAERGGGRLVAVLHASHSEPRIVGEAGYTMLPNGDGELAMVVDPAWRGWLGPYLLDALMDLAAAEGVPNLEADVLTTNTPMLALLRSRGTAVIDHEDWTVVRLMIGTRGERPEWPKVTPVADAPRLLVEGAGGRWPDTSAARAAGVQVLACPGPRAGRRGCPVLEGRPCSLAAEADVILVCRPGSDEPWRRLLAGHPEAQPGVPVHFDADTDVATLVEVARRRADRRATSPPDR